MLPHFHANGLVITRQQDSYSVGDVAAYHNQELHAVVMHRVVARDGQRYVFKGDNNTFADSFHPDASEIVGREWLYWPGAGAALRLVRTPAIFATTMAILGMFGAKAYVPRRSRRRRHHHG
jgi:hypothetical protein